METGSVPSVAMELGIWLLRSRRGMSSYDINYLCTFNVLVTGVSESITDYVLISSGNITFHGTY